jgi:hypothetical protein
VIKDVTVISAKYTTQGEGCAPSWGLFGINQPTIPPPFTAHFSAMTYGGTCDIISSKCFLAKRRDFLILIVAEGAGKYAQYEGKKREMEIPWRHLLSNAKYCTAL